MFTPTGAGWGAGAKTGPGAGAGTGAGMYAGDPTYNIFHKDKQIPLPHTKKPIQLFT